MNEPIQPPVFFGQSELMQQPEKRPLAQFPIVQWSTSPPFAETEYLEREERDALAATMVAQIALAKLQKLEAEEACQIIQHNMRLREALLEEEIALKKARLRQQHQTIDDQAASMDATRGGGEIPLHYPDSPFSDWDNDTSK